MNPFDLCVFMVPILICFFVNRFMFFVLSVEMKSFDWYSYENRRKTSSENVEPTKTSIHYYTLVFDCYTVVSLFLNLVKCKFLIRNLAVLMDTKMCLNS